MIKPAAFSDFVCYNEEKRGSEMTENTEISGVLVAAHELKSPLCTVRQLALALNLTEDADARSRLQQNLINTAERALKQVEDLTRLSRLEDGLFQTEPVCVRAVCDGVLRELRPFFHAERRSLKVKYSNKFRLAVANRDLLRSVIYNFCSNAVKYSNIESESYLLVQDHQDKVRVSVRDFGPALPPKIAKELEKGYLNQPTEVAMRPDSSGLGLFIASQFAHAMQARVGATRHRDGVSFFVDLPVSRQMELAF